MTYSVEDRQQIYTRVCHGIANRLSLRKICAQDGMPTKETIRLWLLDDANFFAQYTRAREARADERAEYIDEITEKVLEGTLDPQAARVIIDAEKWQAGKENSKRYGERRIIQGDDEAPAVKTEVAVSPADKRDLARWIAARLTAAAAEQQEGSE